MSDEVGSLLAERGRTHGSFRDVAAVAQDIKDLMRCGVGWESLTPECRESLELIATKIARVVNSGCGKSESLIDIAGYAELAIRSFNDKEMDE